MSLNSRDGSGLGALHTDSNGFRCRSSIFEPGGAFYRRAGFGSRTGYAFPAADVDVIAGGTGFCNDSGSIVLEGPFNGEIPGFLVATVIICISSLGSL